MTYLLLQHPGHNRVYYNAADKLAMAELQIATQRFSTKSTAINVIEIAGIRYLSFEASKELQEKELQIISKLSFVFAVFLKEDIGNKFCLTPIQLNAYQYIDSKISSLLKYQGKTNELFTKMMINVALLSSNFDYNDNIQLLDPVAGKGTTLFESAVYGFNTIGVEIEPKSVHETTIFFKKYLELERLKHTSAKRQISGTNKAEGINIQEFIYARTKEEFKSPKTTKKLSLVCGNTMDVHKYFKKEIFHLLVGDLPYGIVHGNSGDKRNTAVTRNPSELIKECLPQWKKVLIAGGIIVVAWNSFLVSRDTLSHIFRKNGFNVLSESPYDTFEHMVDKSIKRDIVVAKKV